MQSKIDLDALWKKGGAAALETALQSKTTRNWLLRRADNMLEKSFVEHNYRNMPERIVRMRKRAIMNLLRSVDRGINRGTIGKGVIRSVLSTLIENVLLGERDRMQPYFEKHGRYPPTFITISPTKSCNLQCKGCYAGSSLADTSTMDYEVFTRILNEKREEWGSHFTVISGGEPLLYYSKGKDLLDVVSEHPNDYFMMYTNGTVITEEVAERMAQLGNITPAISVEGWEDETDNRRGKGVFRQVLDAMERLRRYGVPFGVSITATIRNAETLVSDEFLDYFFDEQGAIYGWIFQYMPIGRSYALDLMITPEQRKYMLERETELFYKQDRFLIDFWNSGPLSLGCIAAGRSGGHFYIDWDGNITPCVFFPYAIDNVYDMYERGTTISDVLGTEYFSRIRAWQDYYRGYDGKEPVKNLFRPCPIRDHHHIAEQLITQHDVKPIDPDAELALDDNEYHQSMKEYDKRVEKLLDPLWNERFAQDNGQTKQDRQKQAEHSDGQQTEEPVGEA